MFPCFSSEGKSAPTDVFVAFTKGHTETHRVMVRAATNAKALLQNPNVASRLPEIIKFLKLLRGSLTVHHVIEDMLVFPTVRSINHPKVTLAKEVQDHAMLARMIAMLEPLVVTMEKEPEKADYAAVAEIMRKMEKFLGDPKVGHFSTEENELTEDFLREVFDELTMTNINKEMARLRQITMERIGMSEMDAFAFLVYHMTDAELDVMLKRSRLPAVVIHRIFPEAVREDANFWGSLPLYPKKNVLGQLVLIGKTNRAPPFP